MALLYSYYNFCFEVTLFVVEIIGVTIQVRPFVLFKPILLFRIMHVNITMQDYTIDYYCYHHHQFTVCAFQVISSIVSLIQFIITRKSKVTEVVCFKWKQFLYYLTRSIFLIISHSYFIANIYYFHFKLYHIPTTI